MSFAYIGTPYSSHAPDVMEFRYNAVTEVTASLLIKGIPVYSHITHCHPMAQAHKLPVDFKFWQNYNKAMLSRADLLYVLQLYDWKKSKGLKWEIQFAIENNIPVVYLEYPLKKVTNLDG